MMVCISAGSNAVPVTQRPLVQIPESGGFIVGPFNSLVAPGTVTLNKNV